MATILVEIYRHNLWANLILLDVCAGLSEEQLDLSAPGTYGRVREPLLHLAVGEGRHVSRLPDGLPPTPDGEVQCFPGIPALSALLRRSCDARHNPAQCSPSAAVKPRQ